MPTAYKLLGQTGSSGNSGNGAQTLAATTATNLYVVPSSTSTIVSTITVCNQAATAGTYRIAVRVAGATLAAHQYIAYDVSLPANATDTLTLGLTLAATDVITVYASSANFSFAAFGSELS